MAFRCYDTTSRGLTLLLAQTTQNKTLLSEDEPATTPLTAAASIVGVGAGIVVEDADADDVGGYGGVVDDDEDICTT